MDASLASALKAAVNPRRLADTALALIAIPSPTRSAGPVAEKLASILAIYHSTANRQWEKRWA